jgi:hypothetical protein
MIHQQKNIAGREYHADTASPSNLRGAVSRSMLWAFSQSAYKWRYGKPSTPSPAMEFGSLVHSLCFTPDAVADEFAVSEFDSFRTKAAQEWRDAQVGKAVITQETMNKAQDIVDVVMNDPHLFSLGEKDYEVVVCANIGETPVKGMVDIAPRHGNVLADLKTTGNIGSLDAVMKTVINRGYHWQAALYLDLWNAVTGEDRDQFQFLFVETDSPHETAWVSLDQKMLEIGRSGYMNAIARWQNCLAKDEWPRTIEGVQEITTPIWLSV